MSWITPESPRHTCTLPKFVPLGAKGLGDVPQWQCDTCLAVWSPIGADGWQITAWEAYPNHGKPVWKN